jgi:two-component system, OmpR family, response regulator ChvI
MTATFDQVAMDLDTGAPVLLGLVSEPDAIRVLLIEDGVIDRGLLAQELSKQGFAVRELSSLPGAPNAASDADVIVLHCGRADGSSIDLLLKLRRRAVEVPIVLLTDKALPAHECLALDKGAVDVICKSRGSEVLARRLKAVVRTFGRTDQPRPDECMAEAGQVAQTQSMICGNLLSRPDVSRAYWKDADLGLTLGEYNILHLLALNVGRFVTYRAIYDRLHYEGFIAGSGADGYRANVRSAIRRIRKKFRSIDPTFGKIESYSGFGYCWKKPD